MIGLPGTNITRAYSFTSGPGDDYLEFYSIKVEHGPLTSALQHIQVGDSLEVAERTTGTLTLANIELGGNLWLFATGTGIAPFVSILRDPDTYNNFNTINLAWSVRTNDELLAYHSFLQEMLSDSIHNYYPTVTQETPVQGVLGGRIQEHIANDEYWKFIRPDSDKIMICGSMDFNKDMKNLFVDTGFTEGSKRSAGNFVQEKAFVG
jgi:ferredoxin--NADP+ reductase